MEITKEHIDYLAKLSRIEITPEERESLAVDLSKITDMVAQIDELPTEGVEPLVTISEDTHNFFRDDEIKPSLPIETIENLAPDFQNRCFVVPQVIE